MCCISQQWVRIMSTGVKSYVTEQVTVGAMENGVTKRHERCWKQSFTPLVYACPNEFAGNLTASDDLETLPLLLPLRSLFGSINISQLQDLVSERRHKVKEATSASADTHSTDFYSLILVRTFELLEKRPHLPKGQDSRPHSALSSAAPLCQVSYRLLLVMICCSGLLCWEGRIPTGKHTASDSPLRSYI